MLLINLGELQIISFRGTGVHLPLAFALLVVMNGKARTCVQNRKNQEVGDYILESRYNL